jgi:hypothetical protein
MPKQIRTIATLALAIVGLLCAPKPAHAQAQFKVGSFTKPGVTGAQIVPHNLGVTPKAIIFWTNASINSNNFFGGLMFSFGVTDGTTSRSTSVASQGVVTKTNASRRAAAKPITMVLYGEVLQAEADFTSWDATNFTITWTNVTDTRAWIIHYLVIGGAGVQAQLVDWTTVASGPKAVTGLTFQPASVLHFMDYDTAALPSSVASSAFMLGAMDVDGDQWASAFYSTDGGSPTTTARTQRTDSVLAETDGTAGETLRATFASMNANGFTVNFPTNTTGLAYHVFSLALTGINLHVGSFTRSGYGSTACPAPCLEPVTGLGFQPAAVLFASYVTTASAVPVTQARWGLGATDNTNEGFSFIDDENGVGGSLKTSVNSSDYYHALAVINSGNGSYQAMADIKAGTGGSFDAGGFTVDWTYNSDNVATEIVYLALGPLGATAVTLTSFTATPMSGGRILVAWHTGYEVDNVGFRLYREQNGHRVRITSSIVPGTALIGASLGASNGAREYTFSDTAPASDAGPAQYWLEDIDLKGKSTWHGPFAPGTPSREQPR